VRMGCGSAGPGLPGTCAIQVLQPNYG
jgi:hypothetical protein